MQLLLRPAVPTDVPVVLRFIRELAEYERAPDAVAATEDLLAGALFGEQPVAHAVLALDGDVPVGFALYFFSFSTWLGRAGLYLEDVYVTPAARNRGIGRALLAHLAGIAVERGCGRMEWSVLDWNESAIGFYHSVGAMPLEGWTVFRLTGDYLRALARKA